MNRANGIIAAIFLIGLGIGSAQAQQTQVAFGGMKHDSSQPVEITSDTLGVDQAKGTALFNGEVLAGQGSMRIRADEILVEYQTDGKTITGEVYRMTAKGNVTLTNGAEAAEAQNAIYTIADSKVRMTGDVLLTQGLNAISGEILNINLDDGTAVFEGRVKTIFQPKDN